MNPVGFYKDKNGDLCVQDIKVNDLAQKYGTPLFIYDTGLMKQRYNTFKDSISEVKGNIHYAIKANDALGIIGYFANLGAGADIVSIGEFKKCIAAGIKPEKIIFSGVGKEKYEIEFALRNNVQQFNIESYEELYDVQKIASKLKIIANICLRVNPDITPDTHKKISTGAKSTKFGVDFKDAKKIYEKIHNLDFINPVGLAVHIGSQIFDFSYFLEAYSHLKNLADDLRKHNFHVPRLDLGGGIGIHYNNDEAPNFTEYKKIISDLFKDTDYELSFEPGRSLIAEAGILVTKVIRNKKAVDKNFIIVDVGMNNLIRPTLYDAFHIIEPVIKNVNLPITADIVGPICETGDYIALNRTINNVQNEDLLAIRTTGAYSSVMSSNYNARADANEIIVYNNKDYLIKESESIEKLIKKERMISFTKN